MDQNRFDSITKLFEDRSLSRRRALAPRAAHRTPVLPAQAAQPAKQGVPV